MFVIIVLLPEPGTTQTAGVSGFIYVGASGQWKTSCKRANCSLRSDSSELLAVVLEDFFNGKFEQPRHLKGQWQAWVVLLGFNGVNGLAGNTQFLGQI